MSVPEGPGSAPGHQVTATTLATSVAAIGAAPAFTIGAVAVFMRDSIDFGPADLGLSVFLFYIVASLSGPSLGTVAGRWGSRRAMALATCACVLAMIGLAAAPSRLVVLLVMVLAGLANGMAQLGANVHLSAAVGRGRHGIAFGIRRSATPLASALAGAAVPAVALTVGWRFIFLTFAGLAVATLAGVLAGRRGATRRSASEVPLPRERLTELRLLAGANLLGNAATTAMATFLVLFLTSAHTSAGTAGTMGLLGGLGTVFIRVLLGLVSDRHPLPALGLIGSMMLTGAVALAGFALTGPTWLVLSAVLVAYVVGWGWTGLIDLHVVRDNPGSPGRATGVTYAGQALGAGVGPLVMGWLVDLHGFPVAWCSVAGALAGAGVLVLITSTLRRRR